MNRTIKNISNLYICKKPILENFLYNFYGLTIHSEIEIPELIQCSSIEPDAWIKLGPVPDHLSKTTSTNLQYEAFKDDFLLKIESVAKYRVIEGKYITIHSKDNATLEEIRLFLLGSVMGALLHQKGMLPIHGSCVAKDGKGFIITGNSLAGKSTLAAGLCKKGYSFVTDDIAVVDIRNENKYSVFPGIPYLKLWKDVIHHIDEKKELKRVSPYFEKYRIPIDIPEPHKLNMLEKIIVLSATHSGYQYEEVSGAQKFNLLRQNTYRLQYVEKLNQTAIHFKNLSRMARAVRVFNVRRPSAPINVTKLVQFIENQVLYL